MNAVKTALTVLLLFASLRAVAFFSGSETAFLSLSKIKMRRLVREKRRGAKNAAALHSRMDELLTLVLIGTNFMNTFASAVATSLAVSIAGTSGIGIATVCLTFFATVFGQIIPKTAAVLQPERTVCRNAGILRILLRILFPAVWLFSRLSRFASSLAGNLQQSAAPVVTEEELKTLIEVGEQEGTLEKGESRMLCRIFEFNALRVRDIMKPRSAIQGIAQNASRKEVVQILKKTGLSMLPVYKNESGTIAGIIRYTAVLFDLSPDSQKFYAARMMQRALFVPESLAVPELLLTFRRERVECAVALNEQGLTAGLVTMDDIARVVFGRLSAEAAADIPPEDRITLISPDEFIVPGDMRLSDVNALFNLQLDSDLFQTLGGWLLEQFGKLPSEGDFLVRGSTFFLIEDQAHRRIVSVRLRIAVGS